MTAKLHFISAGAGSGKTYRLTRILHEKLSNGSIRPSGVIATTFTRKAATELRERVRSHLMEMGSYKIANAMGQARINTVNGLCGELLTRFAFEAGISTEQQVLEEAQEKVLLSQAIETVMDSAQTAKLLAIVRRMGIQDWKDDLRKLMSQTRANDIAIDCLAGMALCNADDLLDHFPKVTGDDLAGKLQQVITETLPELESAAAESRMKNTNDYLTLVKEMRVKLGANDAVWSDWVKLANAKPGKGLILLAERIGEYANRYAEHAELHSDIRTYLQMQFMLCEKALKAYADKKREMGVLDFTDQEHLLLKVLDHHVVAATLREELDLLMVDEFQDTSPIQLALFTKLAQLASEVYWVGDMKQAIYGFRGSDAVLMKAVLDALTVLGGDKEVLKLSWRSRAPLVTLVNEVFVPTFAATTAADDIVLTAQRTEKLSGAAFANWHLQGTKIEIRNMALVVGVRQLHDSGYIVFDKATRQTRAIRYGDMAILSRSNDGVRNIAAELKAQGVPAAILQAGLLKTPEAILAIACLRRLNDPSDTIASAEIVSLAGCEAPESWVADRLQFMNNAPAEKPGGYGNSWREEGDQVFPLLAELAALRADMPVLSPMEALQTVVAHGQLSAVVLRWCNNENEARSRFANLEALLGMARDYEQTSRNMNQSASVSGLILWLRSQAEAEADFLAMPAIDAVKVMTHHAAKGLEWPVVILTGLEGKVRDRLWSISAISQAEIDVQHPLKDRFIRFWPWPFGLMGKVTIAETIDNSDIARKLHLEAVEEEKRLLYVSMTRARDLLVMAHHGKGSEDSWLGTVAAGWLQGEVDATTLMTPGGAAIPCQNITLSAAGGTGATAVEPVYWFTDPTPKKLRMPLKFSPSDAKAQSSRVLNNEHIGRRLSLKPDVDMARLGNALHLCIGAHFTDPDAPVTVTEIEAVLQRMGLASAVQPQALLDQINALGSWIKARWPEAVPYAEFPAERQLPNGQLLQGRIDMLLKVNGGWILIDHKSNPGGSDRWEAIAQDYAGQLAAYKWAVETASGEKVLESWLFLPVAAAIIRIELE